MAKNLHFRWALIGMVGLAFGCGGATADPNAPVSETTIPEPAPTPSAAVEPAASEPTPPTTTKVEPVEQVAHRFFVAMLGGERYVAKSLALTHAELSAISHKAPEKAKYEAELDEFLDARAREGREAGSSQSIVGAKVRERRTLRAAESEKLKRDVEFAVVQPMVKKGDQEGPGFPFLFMLTENGWKFSLKK